MKLGITKKRINSLVRPDSVTTSFNDFLITHVKMGQLQLFKKYEDNPESLTNPQYCSEDNLFNNLICNPNNEHRFIIVYGQSGTGKSHLIRWFDAKLQNEKEDNEVILFVSRNDNTLKGTIRQLLAKEEILNMVDTEVYNRLLESSTPIEENKLKTLIYFRLIAEIENDDMEYEGVLKRIDKKKIPVFLGDSVIKKHLFEENGPIERLYVKVAENESIVDRDIVAEFIPSDFEFDEEILDLMEENGSSKDAISIYKKFGMELIGNNDSFNVKLATYLNKFVGRVIQSSVGIQPADFKNVFIDIREALYKQNKNLTLLIEDITSFTGIDQELLDALQVEHTGVNLQKNLCRITSVVGTTREYFRDKFRDNFRDRITDYIYIPESVFTENQLYEFCGKYINAMSLEENEIAHWVSQGANSSDMPVHEIECGKNWDFAKVENTDIELPLYPFTKKAIFNLYNEVVLKDERKKTPRYIIQYIIEPVIREIITNAENFPSERFNKSFRNSLLDQKIQISYNDEKVCKRLYTFMNVWGDGTFEKIKVNNSIKLAGIDESIYKELNLPVIDGAAIEKKEPIEHIPLVTNQPKTSEYVEKNVVSNTKQEEFKKASEALDNWKNTGTIDLTSTGGTSGKIKNAVTAMRDYLIDSIDWQVEGISYDNVQRFRNTKTLFKLQGQNNSENLFQFGYDSYFVVLAFLRYEIFGNKSWNYEDYEWDLYQISVWLYEYRDRVISYVRKCNEKKDSNYIEAAMILDTYFMILSGQYTSLSLNDLTIDDYLKNNYSIRCDLGGHDKTWADLFNLYNDYEDKNSFNYGIVKRYFNLVQGAGNQGTSNAKIVLKYLEFNKLVEKIKNNKLRFDDYENQVNDWCQSRKKIVQKLDEVQKRIEKVAAKELSNVESSKDVINNYFHKPKINKQDLISMWEMFEKFYSATNEANMPIPFNLPDKNKLNFDKIAESFNRVNSLSDKADSLTVILTFSTQPTPDLLVLADIIKKVETSVVQAENEVSKSDINIDYSYDHGKYKNSINVINDIKDELKSEGLIC